MGRQAWEGTAAALCKFLLPPSRACVWPMGDTPGGKVGREQVLEGGTCASLPLSPAEHGILLSQQPHANLDSSETNF